MKEDFINIYITKKLLNNDDFIKVKSLWINGAYNQLIEYYQNRNEEICKYLYSLVLFFNCSYIEADKAITEVLNNNPNFIQAQFLKVEIMNCLNKEISIEYFNNLRKNTSKSEKNDFYSIYLLRTLMLLSNKKEGTKLLKSQLKTFKNPDDYKFYHIYLGEAYNQINEKNKAKKIFNEIVQMSAKSDREIYFSLKSNYYLGDFGKVKQYIKSDLLKNIHFLKLLGTVAYEENNYPESIHYFEEALKKCDFDVEVLVKLGRMYEKRNQMKSYEYYFKATTLVKKFETVYYFSKFLSDYNYKLDYALEIIGQLVRSSLKDRQNELIKNIESKVADSLKNDTDDLFEEINKDVIKRTDTISKNAKDADRKLQDFFKVKSPVTPLNKDELSFYCLRKWNSYSPILSCDLKESVGGGYFIIKNGKGIVIDPGFNFIQNFHNKGFLFNQIDYILITHAHNDHTVDLESILTLLYKYNKILGKTNPHRKNVKIFIGLSTYKKYSGLLNLYSEKVNYKVFIINEGFEYKFDDCDFKFRVIKAKHDDLMSDQYCYGFMFEMYNNLLIYTGDTGVNDFILKEYNIIKERYIKNKSYSSVILLAHLGGFKDEEAEASIYNGEVESFYENHLGRSGLVSLLEIIKPNICLISEFGEEFSGMRVDFTRVFQDMFINNKFIPIDVGFNIHFDKDNRLLTDLSLCEKVSKPLNLCNTYDVDFYEENSVEQIKYICKGE